MYSYKDDGMPYPRYCILKLNNRQVEEMIDGVKDKETILKELNSNTTGTNNSKGCYVATAVYGSYDCPEVWTLRRFRDSILEQTWYGRLFIGTYYSISPYLVKHFGDKKWFSRPCKTLIDKLVKELRCRGIQSTPYVDSY